MKRAVVFIESHQSQLVLTAKVKLIILLILLPELAVSQNYDELISENQNEIEVINSETSIDVSLSGSLTIQDAPDAFSNRIVSLSSGDIIKVIGIEERYFRILYENDKEGFVPRIILDRVTSNEEIFEIYDRISELRTEIEELTIQRREAEVETLEKEREELQMREEAERQRLSQLHNKIRSKLSYVNVFSGNMRESPSTDGSILNRLPQGEKVYLQEKKNQWYQVKIPNTWSMPINSEEAVLNSYDTGWIHESILSEEPVKMLSKSERRRIGFVNNNPQISDQQKQDILEGTIRIGMTKEVAEACWGRPLDINRTVTANMVREQWVYGSVGNRRYLYFRNGILDSFQD